MSYFFVLPFKYYLHIILFQNLYYFVATQLQDPPLESVVAKYKFAVNPEPDAANFTVMSVFLKSVPAFISEFQLLKTKVLHV